MNNNPGVARGSVDSDRHFVDGMQSAPETSIGRTRLKSVVARVEQSEAGGYVITGAAWRTDWPDATPGLHAVSSAINSRGEVEPERTGLLVLARTMRSGPDRRSFLQWIATTYDRMQ